MAEKVNEFLKLREIIANVIYHQEVWSTLPDVCKFLGFTLVENEARLGKQKYLHKVTSEASDETILTAAERILSSYPGDRGRPSQADLQHIQDSLWWIESQGIQRISNVTRYRIIESLEGTRFWGRLNLRDIFNTTIPCTTCMILPEVRKDGGLYRNQSSSLLGAILSGDMDVSITDNSPVSLQEFMKKIGLIDWPDKRFFLFIERIVHPEVHQLEIQKQLVDQINSLLQFDGYELKQEDLQSNLPVYKVRKISVGVTGLPKYIIFASNGPKPDIVVEDAVNMNIKIVQFAEKCLVYDQPPSSGDLTWEMLLEWWGRKNLIDPQNDDVRRDFGFRLRDSLQSKPECMLFDTYFKVFKPKLGDKLPALLPQVYLHYDPRNMDERDKPVLARQRMDFLLLLRNSVRIVIEIDGIQHYSNEKKLASPEKYAKMVAEDRRIRLLGYDIYRFGGAEFLPSTANKTIEKFFELFGRYLK